MKKIMMALMLCLVSIAGFAEEQEEKQNDFTTDIETAAEETAADEAEADAEAVTYKTFDENGKIIIVTPTGKFNLLGAPIK